MPKSQVPEEFVRFVRESGPRLFRVAYLLTGDTSRAEDLYQEACARAYASWRGIRGDDAYHYVRRVLVNLHIDWWRRRYSREWLVPAFADRPGGEDPAARVTDRDQVVRALQALSPRERAVIVLRYFADLSEFDTARTLGVSAGTVKSTTSRAMAKLRVSPELRDRQPTATVLEEK
jgi:RNA polymerase sigma-70 factor (sigma-E family)